MTAPWKPTGPSTTRREFLRIAVGGAIWGGASFGLFGCASLSMVRASAAKGRVFVRWADIEALAPGTTAFAVDVPQLAAPILLIRGDGGAYRALSSECTHQSCRVRPSRGFLTCPCHGSVFDLEGSVVRGPAREPLARYSVRSLDGGLEIDATPGGSS